MEAIFINVYQYTIFYYVCDNRTQPNFTVFITLKIELILKRI